MEVALNINQINTQQNSKALLRGIDDMEAGREMPIREAFEKITELRNMRRAERNTKF